MAAVSNQIYTASGQQPQLANVHEDYVILLKCLQRALRPDGGTVSLSIPTAHIRWPSLLALAHRHEVIPLLEFGLRDVSGVPAPVRRWLGTYCRTVVGHNLSLASELAGLLESFDESQLSAVPFKGPAWAVALYGNLALRQMADIDIFIERSQARQVFKLLRDRGYVLSGKFKVMSAEEIRHGCKDVELINPESGVHLEVHWSACEPWFDGRLAKVKLWEPAWTAQLLNRGMPLPSPEDLFFLIALHGFRHRWESLKSICDVAAAIDAFPALDWPALLSKAAKLSRTRMILLPLALAQRVFGTQLPACVAKAIAQDPAVPALARQLQQQHYLDSEGAVTSFASGVRGLIYREAIRIRSRENFVDRMSLLATLLFNLLKPTANDRRCFSPRTLPEPLYWFVRPLRLLGAYGPAALAHFTGQLIAPLCRP